MSHLSLLVSALKIHVSPQTKEVLDVFGNFETELRGDVEMKVLSFVCLQKCRVYMRPSVLLLTICYYSDQEDWCFAKRMNKSDDVLINLLTYSLTMQHVCYRAKVSSPPSGCWARRGDCQSGSRLTPVTSVPCLADPFPSLRTAHLRRL